MFRLIDNTVADGLEIEFEGEPVTVPGDISLAAALLYLDAIPIRQSVISGSPRAPFCMMGACFECLVEIDGIENQLACEIKVRAGMKVRRQLTSSRRDPGK